MQPHNRLTSDNKRIIRIKFFFTRLGIPFKYSIKYFFNYYKQLQFYKQNLQKYN